MDLTALFEILACTAAASFHLGVGACMAFSSIAIPQLEAQDSDIQVDKDDVSWLASLISLVMPVGALVTGYLADRLGRLNTIRLGCVPYCLGWLCIALAQDFPTLLLGRLLTGFSLALGANPAVVYITEVARSELRGALICSAPSLASLGMVLVYAKGAYLHWRVIAWICIIYCVVPLLLMSLWTPESPVWLVSRGKVDRARESLAYLLRKEKQQTDLVEQRLAQLMKAHHSEKQVTNRQGSTLGNLVRGLLQPTGFKPLLILTLLFLFQQLSGIYITIFYTVSFFKDMGASIDPYLSTVGIGVVRLVMGIISMFLFKRFNRRPLFILSALLMAFFISISGYFTKLLAEGKSDNSWVPTTCVLLYMSVGVMGFMSIPWTMTAELFPLEIRGMAQGLMIAIVNTIMFFVLKIYPFLAIAIGGSYAVQWFFAASTLVGTVFVYLFLPETHRKELSEIEDYFVNNTLYILSKKVEVVVEEEGEEMVKLNGKEISMS